LNRYMLIAPLAIFGISGILLWFYFFNPNNSGLFHDNLAPELIGFCLEGFFLVGLLSYVQQIREHERRQELWLSLRGSLREMLSFLDIAFLKSDEEPTESKALETNPAVVIRLIKELEQTELNLDSMIAVKQSAISGLELAHDLIPVAAQLSAAHMRWWIAIVDSMKKLSEARQRDRLEQAVFTFLQNLKEFDKLAKM